MDATGWRNLLSEEGEHIRPSGEIEADRVTNNKTVGKAGGEDLGVSGER